MTVFLLDGRKVDVVCDPRKTRVSQLFQVRFWNLSLFLFVNERTVCFSAEDDLRAASVTFSAKDYLYRRKGQESVLVARNTKFMDQ